MAPAIDPAVDECLLRLTLAAKPYNARRGKCMEQWAKVSRAVARELGSSSAPVLHSAMRAMSRFRFLRLVFADVEHPLHTALTPTLYAMLSQVQDTIEQPAWTPKRAQKHDKETVNAATAPDVGQAPDQGVVERDEPAAATEVTAAASVTTRGGLVPSDPRDHGALTLERVHQFMVEDCARFQRATGELHRDLAARDMAVLQRENEQLRSLLSEAALQRENEQLRRLVAVAQAQALATASHASK